jgi:hypothetical protein
MTLAKLNPKKSEIYLQNCQNFIILMARLFVKFAELNKCARSVWTIKTYIWTLSFITPHISILWKIFCLLRNCLKYDFRSWKWIAQNQNVCYLIWRDPVRIWRLFSWYSSSWQFKSQSQHQLLKDLQRTSWRIGMQWRS